MNNILRLCLIMMYNMSIFFIIISLGYKNVSCALISTTILLIANLIYGFRKTKSRILFVLLNLSIFTFLLGENIIMAIYGKEWMQEFSSEVILHCYVLVFIALIGLVIGNYMYEKLIIRLSILTSRKPSKKYYNIDLIRKISFFIFIISGICKIIEVLKQVNIVSSIGYIESYTIATNVPIIILKIGQLFTYSFFIYLSTLPNKKNSVRIIIMYYIYLLLTLKTGVRGTFVYNSFAIVFYYTVRHYTDKNEKWISKNEKIFILAGTPILLVALVLISNIRIGDGIEMNKNILELIIEFFKQQGGSIRIIGYGKIHDMYIANLNQNYTFGPIINLLNSILNGIHYNTNTIDIALYGNSFGSTISYIMMPEVYVSGGGLGSSYLAEVYVDYGYLGTLVFNLILGMILSWINTKANYNWMSMSIGLMCIVGIVSMPRGESIGWLRSTVSISGIGLIILIYVLSELLSKYRIRT